MEVDDAAPLVLRDLDEPDSDELAELLAGDAAEAGQMARQEGFEALPQLPGYRVEQHRGPVVVAAGAHRAAKPRIILAVAHRAGDIPAMRAHPLVAVTAGSAGQHLPAALTAGMDRAERRGGDGGEHARVSGDRFGDAFAAGQARAHQLAGIALVDGRAGRAHRFAAVAAGDMQRVVITPGI